MGWFEEQIKMRRDSDNEALDDSLKNVSAVIEGKKGFSFGDDREKLKGVLDEILAFYHIRSREIPPEIKDLSEQMEYLFHPHGIMYRPVKLETNWYKNASGAMLGKLKTGDSVALLPDKLGRYGYYDPSTHKKIRLNAKTEKLLEEDAHCFYKPFPLRKIGIRDLITYILGAITPATIAYVIILTLCTTLVGMITPRITKLLFSDVLESGSVSLLLSIAVLNVCISLSSLMIRGIKSLLMGRISVEMNLSVQAATMARVLSLPTDFFKKYNSGEITSRAQYIGSLCQTLAQTFLSTGLTSIFSLVYITQVFVYAKELVVPSLCITLITLAFSIVSSFAQMKISKKQMELSSKMSGMTYQMITGVQKIKLSGGEKRMFARWMNEYAEESRLTYNPPEISAF